MSEPGTESPPAPAITCRWLRDVVEAIGDLARPFAMYSIGATTAWAVVVKDVDATKLGAAGLILSALYGTKGWEKIIQTKADAAVKTAGSQ